MFGHHTFYILGAYGCALVIFVSAILWGIIRYKNLRKSRVRLDIEVSYLKSQLEQNNHPAIQREAS